MIVFVYQFHLELLLTGVAAGFVIENLSSAGDRMIQGIRAVAVVTFAFFFTVSGARLDLGAVTEFWLAASTLILVRAWLTRLGARKGTAWAGADARVRMRSWQGLISQGGVSLGLILVVQERFEAVGDDLLALAMAVILGNILAGPVLLARALTAPDPTEEAP
jgi:Kef-type K+ transport system membrane component KefB